MGSSLFSKTTSETNQIEIYGVDARVTFSLYHFDSLDVLTASMHPGDIQLRILRAIRTLLDFPRVAPVIFSGGDFVATYRNEWQHFIECIQKDKPVGCTLEDGRRALQIALAALQSTAHGKPVSIAEATREITPVVRRSVANV